MTRPLQAVLNLDALHHNLQRVRRAAPGKRIWAVVKANAYGHGLSRVAQALSHAEGHAVASLDEALCLRGSGVTSRVLLLEGFFDAAELREVAHHRLDVVVHTPEQVELLERVALPKPVRTWFKLDSGMHRLGFAPQQCAEFLRRIAACPAVAGPVGLMTHLASADARADPFTRTQLRLFETCMAGRAGERSVANSAAILAWPEAHADWVRPGIMLYGISPFPDSTGLDYGLVPVMTLRTRLIAVKRVRRGGAIGYGGAWSCPHDTRVGVAAMGYGDGYPRHAPSGTPVLVNGQRAPLIGRVSMDMISVDLNAQPDARPGDEVIAWGDGLPAEEVAAVAGTIAYELVCKVTSRVAYDVARSPRALAS